MRQLLSIVALGFYLLSGGASAQTFQNNLTLGNGPNWNFDYVAKGGTSGGGTNSNDPNLSTATALGAQEGDVLISACTCTDSSAPATCAMTGPTGITNLTNQTHGNDRTTVYQTVVTTANKATNVVCTNPGSNSGGTTAVMIALRGVDPINITDATSTTSTSAAGVPDPASITPVHDRTAVIGVCGANVSDTTVGDLTNYATTTPGRQTLNQADTNPGTTAISWRMVAAAAAENPSTWSAWTSSNYACTTIALRPFGN